MKRSKLDDSDVDRNNMLILHFMSAEYEDCKNMHGELTCGMIYSLEEDKEYDFIFQENHLGLIDEYIFSKKYKITKKLVMLL